MWSKFGNYSYEHTADSNKAMLRSLCLNTVLLMLLAACGKPAPPEEAKKALEELQRLDSRIEIGIARLDYSKSVGDAKFATEQYEATKDAERRPEFTQPLKAAVNGHLLALEYWECDSLKSTEDYNIAAYKCRDDVVKSVYTQYPDIATKVTNAGQGLTENTIVQLIWQHTDEDAKKATEELKKD